MLPTPIIPNPDYNLVYEPAEDSFLFLDLFEQLHNEKYFLKIPNGNSFKTVLELGTGTGIISTFISINNIIPNAFHLASDINLNALKTTIKTYKRNYNNNNDKHEKHDKHDNTFDVIRCNLTDSIRSNQIDILLFNPPYVPSEEIPLIPSINDDKNDNWLDLALVGGKDGMIITDKILNSLNNILSINGEAYILFCARNNHPTVISNFLKKYPNFKIDCVISRKCGWEELAIYRFIKQC